MGPHILSFNHLYYKVEPFQIQEDYKFEIAQLHPLTLNKNSAFRPLASMATVNQPSGPGPGPGPGPAGALHRPYRL